MRITSPALLSAARALLLDNLDATITSRLAAADYAQLTKGLTEHAAGLGRAYAELASQTYADLLVVVGAGYLTSLILQVKNDPTPNCLDFVIEIDGVNVAPFTAHSSASGNMDPATPADCVCLKTTWDADYTEVIILNPLYRFDTGFKLRLFNNHGSLGRSFGSFGSCTYLTE